MCTCEPAAIAALTPTCGQHSQLALLLSNQAGLAWQAPAQSSVVAGLQPHWPFTQVAPAGAVHALPHPPPAPRVAAAAGKPNVSQLPAGGRASSSAACTATRATVHCPEHSQLAALVRGLTQAPGAGRRGKEAGSELTLERDGARGAQPLVKGLPHAGLEISRQLSRAPTGYGLKKKKKKRYGLTVALNLRGGALCGADAVLADLAGAARLAALRRQRRYVGVGGVGVRGSTLHAAPRATTPRQRCSPPDPTQLGWRRHWRAGDSQSRSGRCWT